MPQAIFPTYLERFLAASARNAARTAVVEDGRDVSYAEFESLARRIALRVRDAEASRVLVHLPQGAAAYAAMLATGLAGGFYSTSNVAAPQERQRMVFEEFSPEAVITSAEFREEVTVFTPAAKIIDVRDLGETELRTPAPPHRLAYVMFTSGSTGRPKGVMIPQNALSHYVAWVVSAMGVVPEDRWSQHPNIAFDLSVLDIYGALCAGAALVPIVRPEDLLMPAKAIRRYGLTIWDSVPSVVSSMVKIGQVTPANFASLRLLTFCGEPLQEFHLDAVFGARPDVVVHNTYGPTEATVSCTLLRLVSDNYKEACRGCVALGDPIPGMAIELQGGKDGDEGEIVIAGPQVAEGYWNAPELTDKHFSRYMADGKEQRTYRTGDWGRRAGRHLFFAERIDDQVKVRGERIELGDIGAGLMKCGLGFACAVMVGFELHGFFESEAQLPPIERIRQIAGRYLPTHLIPTHVHAVPDLPRNANGKVDLAALRLLAADLCRKRS